MKQFNLEEYLKNPSRKVVTRDGRSVKIHCTNFKSFLSDYSVIAEIEGLGCSETFNKNGEYYVRSSKNDLFFAPERHEGWINLYKCENSTKCHTSNPYDSEEKAIELGKMNDNYLKTVKIEWEA